MVQSTGRFEKLHSLGPEKVAEITDMLQGGIAAREIVALIQVEWGMLLDTKADTLKKMLERYRSTDVKQALIDRVQGATKHVSVVALGKKLNALDEMTALVDTQKRRFQKVLVQEDKQDKFLMKNVSEEAKLFKEMLVELGKLQLETGVLHRAPRTLTGRVTDENGNLKSFEWTDAQAALGLQIEGFIIDHDAAEVVSNFDADEEGSDTP